MRDINNGQFYPPNDSILEIKHGPDEIFGLDGVCFTLHLFFCRFNVNQVKVADRQPQSFFGEFTFNGFPSGFD